MTSRSLIVHNMGSTCLKATTTHFYVLGLTQQRNHLPTFHISSKHSTFNAFMVAFSVKISRKCTILSKSQTQCLWHANPGCFRPTNVRRLPIYGRVVHYTTLNLLLTFKDFLNAIIFFVSLRIKELLSLTL